MKRCGESRLSSPVTVSGITRHGKRQAVVVSYEEWERLSTVPSFGRLLMAVPLTVDDVPGRDNSSLRKPGP
jgi:antitoxin Phd